MDCVCSTLTHSCEAWTLTRTVVRMINGFNSRCLHAITGEEYRTAATVPVYNLVLAPTEVPRPRAASASREHCATLPVGACEGRRALPGGQSAAVGSPVTGSLGLA